MVEGTYALQGKERSNALLGERREIFDLGWGMASKLLGCCLLSRCESDLRALSNDSSFTRGSKKKEEEKKESQNIYIYIYIRYGIALLGSSPQPGQGRPNQSTPHDPAHVVIHQSIGTAAMRRHRLLVWYNVLYV